MFLTWLNCVIDKEMYFFFNITLGRAVLCVIFKPNIMSSLIKISDVIHALYHWDLELRHSCKKCENGRSSMQNKS